ncbi:MAG TPA: adenosylcobinamide-phosphate synthase CbiB [Desulfatiglandales bacterium]|nr:adenosylcobinamide-phosphate synthase CbiB [Desulfatiglandales bacterium]
MSDHVEAPLVLFLAFVLDMLMGDPEYDWHPVRIMGRGIMRCLSLLKRIGIKGRAAGCVLTLVMVFISLSVYALIRFILLMAHPIISFLFDLFVCYSCLALKDLFDHIRPVIKALESEDLYEARKNTGMVVGRDVNTLDMAGVTRAAIETMAENFVDGFLSPVFWYVAGCVAAKTIGVSPVSAGISLMIVFKAASTLDSMIGHKNEEFLKIGWAGARLDDAMNYMPARLSLIILFFGSWLNRLHPIDGLRVAIRDRLKHDSPNSAHAESFVSGALNIRLGGPTKYTEGIKDRPWLGSEYPDPNVKHITMSMGLLKISSWIAIIIAGVILFSQDI